jgi:hypothetical protein
VDVVVDLAQVHDTVPVDRLADERIADSLIIWLMRVVSTAVDLSRSTRESRVHRNRSPFGPRTPCPL